MIDLPVFTTMALELEQGIATLYFNRPAKLNAFTSQMIQEFMAVLDFTDACDEVLAVIVTGRGRAFCAGADLSDGAQTFASSAHTQGNAQVSRDEGGLLTLRIFRSLKPIIAAINGAAVGVGATMTLAMDIRLASSEARFGFVFSRLGIVPEAASSWFLSRIVGMSTALYWCYSGKIVKAPEALEHRLVHALHPPAELLEEARSLAHSLVARSAPVSLAVTRQLMWRMSSVDHPMLAHRLDSRAIEHLGRSADAREGVTAFLEGRPARFTGRVSVDMPAGFDWPADPDFI